VESEGLNDEFAVAYAVSKTVGNAVVRNRIRRQLRAIFDYERAAIVPGLYLIKCDISAKDLPYDQLRKHVVDALERGELRR
jgi:ribonuclease P protein component